MIKQLFLFFISIVLLSSCKNESGEVVESEPVPLPPYRMPAALEEIRQFADLTFTDTVGLNRELAFSEIDETGAIRNIHFEQAVKLYKELSRSNQSKRLPIFEIKNSERAILAFRGKGFGGRIWAKALIDRKTRKLLKVEFGHQGESDDYGAVFTEESFTEQFVDTEIAMNDNTFGLVQKGKNIVKGQSEVDGITGATITSQGATMMLNEGFKRYLPYIENTY